MSGVTHWYCERPECGVVDCNDPTHYAPCCAGGKDCPECACKKPKRTEAEADFWRVLSGAWVWVEKPG